MKDAGAIITILACAALVGLAVWMQIRSTNRPERLRRQLHANRPRPPARWYHLPPPPAPLTSQEEARLEPFRKYLTERNKQ